MSRRRPSVPKALPVSAAVGSVVVITKHNFMGDTIVAVPLLRGVRRAFPQAQVTLLTGGMAAVALQNCPHTDRILTYSPKKEKGVSPFLRLLRGLKGDTGRRPDLCLVADRSLRSGVIAWATGAAARAGFDTEGRGWLLTHPVPYDPHSRREIESCLDILRAVAPEAERGPYDPAPELWITDAERARGAEILREHEATGPVLLGIQPGASYDGKQWATERFAAAADRLARASGGVIVLLGSGEREVQIARTMRAAMAASTPVVDLTGQTKLRETMGVLPHLTLFLGNDTGVSHLAASLGVPTVQLFGPTSARKWGHVGPNNRVLDGPGNTLETIPVEAVVDAALGLLGLHAAAERIAGGEAVASGSSSGGGYRR
jgi:ADP-heptose:LPS heptosyltransferase